MLFYIFIVNKISDDYLLFLSINHTILRRSLSGKLDFVFVAGMEVESREGEIVFTTLTVINLIYLL